MENKNKENDISKENVVAREKTVNKENVVSEKKVTKRNTKKRASKNKTTNENVIKNAIVIAVILFLIILLFVIVLFNNLKDKNENSVPTEAEQVEFAKSVLNKFHIAEYLSNRLNTNVEINKNILDPTVRKDVLLYFYSTPVLEKYDFHFSGADYIYTTVKYGDFASEFSDVFGFNTSFKAESIAMEIPKLVKATDGKFAGAYEVAENAANTCGKSANLNDCYALLVSKVADNTSVTFSNLKVKDKVISGDVKLAIQVDLNETVYLDGKFQFEYKEKNNEIFVKSLKIVQVNDAFHTEN